MWEDHSAPAPRGYNGGLLAEPTKRVTDESGNRVWRHWRVAFLVGTAIAISYLDRQTLPVAIHAIAKDIPVSNEQFSTLQSAFLLSYAFMYMGGGRLTDALGTKLGFTVIMAFWSFACASHALATGFTMLVISRFLLGAGEGGGFPAATRAVAEWFSTADRSTAMGIINMGTSIGAVFAPPMIAVVITFLSWRWIFLITGALGLLWTAWWRVSYFLPETPPEPDSPAVAVQDSSPQLPEPQPNIRWIDLFRVRESWGLVSAKFLSDAAWYFYLFWLPKYLYDARGFDVKAVGMFAWIPYAAAGVGCLLGGWFSSYLIRRNCSLGVARKVALGLSAALMPFIVLVPYVPVAWALVIFSLAYFGQQSWSTLVMVVPADLFPNRLVGSMAGLVGFGGAMGGVVFGEVVGYLLDHGFGYGIVFALAGSFHVIAFFIILAAIPTMRPEIVQNKLSYSR